MSTCHINAQRHCQSGYNSKRFGTSNCRIRSGIRLQFRLSSSRIDKFYLPKRWDLEWSNTDMQQLVQREFNNFDWLWSILIWGLTCPNVFTAASNTGTITSTILLSNTIYTFTCNSLYFLPRPNKVAQDYICQANATWNLPFEPCVRKQI